MLKLKNIMWVRSLMITSQLLLVVFIGQWLIGQYNEEKNLLRKDLYQQFTQSKNQVMDSMIVFKLINPIIKNKEGVQLQMRINDPLVSKNFHSGKMTETLTIDDGKKNSDRIRDTAVYNAIAMHTYDSKAHEILVRGVKLLMHEEKNEIENEFYFNTDTLMLNKLLSENLNRSGFHVTTHWIAGNKIDSIGKKNSSIYFETGLFPESYGVEIGNYKMYLFKKITPQILFALVLLLLTGAALLISYRSLRNQMRLSALKNDFISNISHELKTPVSTVKVAIEALQNFDAKSDPKITGEYLDIASLEMNRLELLISKVLNTSMLEEGKQLIRPERTDVIKLIEECLKTFQLRFGREQAVVKFERTKEELYANIDKIHIEGVLMNLLDNSLKYGNEKPEIILKVEEADDKIILSVSDNGPGIPEEYVDKVFEKFFRVPSGSLHNVKGHGLGLSYAALVMRQHHEKISVKNNPGNGCTFTLTFSKA